jgi:glycosyltransferase involved in cell wall biosynthesis
MARVPMKVSVVVPVYNPGDHIQPLIDSLLRQSLPADEFEAIFVNDGSTDSTPTLLDKLAAAHPHMHVIHQANSGWPGKPRNVGIAAAQGDYVFFSDNDDWFGDEALERMYNYAIRNDADIVIGKMIGHNRGVPRELFRRNRDRATFENSPLQDSLTPHKLFRRAMLDKHNIRFPEGKRRLEDHVFVMRAYFAADVISVLSDYDCYHHIGRPDVSNAGYDAIEPKSYYGYVRETIDIVNANTEPGIVQDRLHRRFLRVEMLRRLEGRQLTTLPRAEQRALFDEARRLMVDTMQPSVEDGMPGRQRLQGRLLRAGNFEAIVRLAEWKLLTEGKVEASGWQDGRLTVQWSARTGYRGLLRRDADGLQLVVPHLRKSHSAFDVTRDINRIKVDVVALDAQLGEVVVSTAADVEVATDGSLRSRGTAVIDFGAGVTKLPAGFWTVRLRVRALGWVSDSMPLRWSGSRPANCFVPAGLLVRPARTQRGALALAVGAAARWLDPAFAFQTDATIEAPSTLSLVLPCGAAGLETVGVRVGETDLLAKLTAAGEPWRTVARVDCSSARGAVRLDAGGRGRIALGRVVVDKEGDVKVVRPERVWLRLAGEHARVRASYAVGSAITAGNRMWTQVTTRR